MPSPNDSLLPTVAVTRSVRALFFLDIPGCFFQRSHNTVGALDFDSSFFVWISSRSASRFSFEALFQFSSSIGSVLIRTVDGGKTAGFCRSRSLPMARCQARNDLFRIVFTGSGVNLIKYIQGTFLESGRLIVLVTRWSSVSFIAPGSGMPRVEQHQNQVGESDYMVCNSQRGGTLGHIGIKAWRSLSGSCPATARWDMFSAEDIGVDTAASPLATRSISSSSDRTGIWDPGSRHARRGVGVLLPAVTDNAESIVYRLISGALQLETKIVVDKRGFYRRKTSQALI